MPPTRRRPLLLAHREHARPEPDPLARLEGTTPEFLRRAVRLRANSVANGDRLDVKVDVANVGAGHHVPTGVTLRNLILVVSATERGGSTPAPPALPGSEGPQLGRRDAPEAGAFGGLPGKGYARVLVDELPGRERALSPKAVRALRTTGIPAGQTDSTSYAFKLPPRFAKQDVAVTKPALLSPCHEADRRSAPLNVPLNGNPHGTRGDGTDYDENFVVTELTNFLTCRGQLAKVSASVDTAAGTFTAHAVLKIPRGKVLDPGASGVQVTLGDAARPGGLLQERVSGFTQDGRTTAHDGGTTELVKRIEFARAGSTRTGWTLSAAGLEVAGGSRALVFGIDGGDVCFRRPLRCRTRAATVTCR